MMVLPRKIIFIFTKIIKMQKEKDRLINLINLLKYTTHSK